MRLLLPLRYVGIYFSMAISILSFVDAYGQAPFPRARLKWSSDLTIYGTVMSEAIDSTSDIYMVGTTPGSALIKMGDDTSYDGGESDGMLVKFSKDGTLKWGTYIGGSNLDRCTSVAIDNKDLTVVVAGITKSASGIATDATTRKGIFVAKYTHDGTKLWGTNFGGSKGIDWIQGVNVDWVYNVVVDGNSNIYITGRTESTDLPKTIPGNSFNGYNDAFLAKFSPDGVLEWSRYFGGVVGERGNTLAIDKNSNVWMAGITSSSDGIALNGLDNPDPDYNTCGFIAQFSPSGEQLWGTFYGDTHYLWNTTEFTGIAFDSKGDLVATGYTTATSNIAYNGYDETLAGYYDMFILKLSSNKEKMWATYIGGEEEDQAHGLAIDSYDNIFINGATNNDSLSYAGFLDEFPGNGFQTVHLIAKYSAAGEPMWSSYYDNMIYSQFGSWGNTILLSDSALFIAGRDFISIEDLNPSNIKPDITSVTYGSALGDSTLVITGTGFGSSVETNIVAFNDTTTLTILAATTTELICAVDSIQTKGAVTVTSIGGSDSFEFELLVTSASDVQIEKTYLYPNPSQGRFRIGNFTNAISAITILDTTGKPIYHQTVSESNHDREITVDTKPGLYFVELTYHNRKEIIKWVAY